MNEKPYQIKKLHTLEDGKLSGPMSPMLSAEILSKHFERPMIGLYRVYFDDVHFYNEDDGPDGITGYDHLLCIMPGFVVFFVDQGVGVEKIGAAFGNGETLTDEEDPKWLKYLEDAEIRELLTKSLGLEKACIQAITAHKEEKA